MNDNRHSKTLCFNLYDNSDKVPILFLNYPFYNLPLKQTSTLSK